MAVEAPLKDYHCTTAVHIAARFEWQPAWHQHRHRHVMLLLHDQLHCHHNHKLSINNRNRNLDAVLTYDTL